MLIFRLILALPDICLDLECALLQKGSNSLITCGKTEEIIMPKNAHQEAASHHENAAKAHRTAAEHHGKGNHEEGKKHSTTAHEHSGKAHEASKTAHQKSQQQK
jgi:hypothetical protein